MRREDWEASQQQEDGGGGLSSSSALLAGGFDKAPEEQLKRRRIIKVGRSKWMSGATSSTEPSATPAILPQKPPPSLQLRQSNPFANIGKLPSAPAPAASGTTTNATVNPFANIAFAPAPAPSPAVGGGGGGPKSQLAWNIAPTSSGSKRTGVTGPRTTTNGFPSAGVGVGTGASAAAATTATQSTSSSSRLSLSDKANLKFLKYIRENKDRDPLSDWSVWVKEYINYGNIVEREFRKRHGDGKKSKTSATYVGSALPTPSAPISAPNPFFESRQGEGSGLGQASTTSLPSSSQPATSSAAAPFPRFSFASHAPTPPITTAPLFGITGSSRGSSATGTASLFATNNINNSNAGTGDGGGGDTNNDNTSLKDKPEKAAEEQNTEEDCLYQVRSKYYKLISGQWKDFSSGPLRVYQHKTHPTKKRMVLRNDTGKVQLNVSITKGMRFEKVIQKTKGFVRFIAIQDENVGVEKFMLAVKVQNVDQLHQTLVDLAK